MAIIFNIVGIALVLAICFLLSYDRKAIKWGAIVRMLVAELVIAFIIVKVPVGAMAVQKLSDGITNVINCGNEGLSFVFGDLMGGTATIYEGHYQVVTETKKVNGVVEVVKLDEENPTMQLKDENDNFVIEKYDTKGKKEVVENIVVRDDKGELKLEYVTITDEKGDATTPVATYNSWVFITSSLGNIIFVSALVSSLYYLGAIGFVVKYLGKAVGLITQTTEVETFVAVANMFLGHTDSPILVAKYLPRLTDSEIFVILVSGMGSMSASILGGYSALGIPMKNLLIASALVPIGSIMVSKVMCPQTEEVQSVGEVKMDNHGNNTNVIDALSDGCNTGIQMVISIGASIVGFMGVMAIFDMILGVVNLSFAQIFGYVFAPFGFLMGFGADAAIIEGTLLGQKLILNEFIAFGDLVDNMAKLSETEQLIATISLCGFANISSMGMCIGGIGVLCPEKRGTISRLIVKATLAGVFVSINSAFFVSMMSRLPF